MKRYVIATASALFLLAGTAAASVPFGPAPGSVPGSPSYASTVGSPGVVPAGRPGEIVSLLGIYCSGVRYARVSFGVGEIGEEIHQNEDYAQEQH